MEDFNLTYKSPVEINASEGIGEILTYINLVTNSMASIMILVAIYIIVIMGYYRTKNDLFGGGAVAGFVTFVIALLFWLGGFVNGYTFAFTIAIMVIGVVIVLVTNES